MATTIKAAEVSDLEKQIVWSVVSGFIMTDTLEFSNPTDLVSMHHFMIDALAELDTYTRTKNDVMGMKWFACELFLAASQKIKVGR